MNTRRYRRVDDDDDDGGDGSDDDDYSTEKFRVHRPRTTARINISRLTLR